MHRLFRLGLKKYETYTSIFGIKGIKFILRGKLKGKPRKSCVKFLAGLTPHQSTKVETHYSKLHTYNRYGAYGFRV